MNVKNGVPLVCGFITAGISVFLSLKDAQALFLAFFIVLFTLTTGVIIQVKWQPFDISWDDDVTPAMLTIIVSIVLGVVMALILDSIRTTYVSPENVFVALVASISGFVVSSQYLNGFDFGKRKNEQS